MNAVSQNPFREWLDRFLMPLDDPGSRLFHVNLLIALLLVVMWLVLRVPRRQVITDLKRLVFRKKYWWNRSTRVDYQLYLLNSIFKVFLFIPFLDWSFHVSRSVSSVLIEWRGDALGVQPTTLALLAFTWGVFVWDDFLRFLHHVAMHRVGWLWRLHRTHHSARVLTPVTLYRTHPIESAMATVRNGLSLGVASGVFIFLFGARFSVLTLFGVNVFGFLFNFFGANLRHSHIAISFGPLLEKILISPKQHQIHHSLSTDHHNKNFGVSLAIWDKLFGTLLYSKNNHVLSFGLRGQRAHGLATQLDKVRHFRRGFQFGKSRERV